MSDIENQESETAEWDAITPPPPDPAEPAVAYVVPAATYDAIHTDAEHLHPAVELPTAPAAPDTGTVEAVHALGETLNRRLDALQAIFEREARAEASRERVVDRLHAELQEYKQDLLLKVMRPVFVDLIQLHDDIGKMAQGSVEDGEVVARQRGALQGIQQGIEDILYRQGVEPFAIEADAFDPRRQRAVSTVAAEDPALNKTVAARLRKGFAAGDKVIRPEVVTVYAVKK